MLAYAYHSVQLPSPHWVNIHGVVVVGHGVGQDVWFVYNFHGQLLSFGPRHFVSGAGGFTFAIERELTILGNDVAH